MKQQLDFCRSLSNSGAIPPFEGNFQCCSLPAARPALAQQRPRCRSPVSTQARQRSPGLIAALLVFLLVSSAQAQTNEISFTTADWFSSEADNTSSVAWGDVDGDGDLDLAVGNNGESNRLYRNESGLLTVGAVWSSEEKDSTTSVAWGDVDGDGDLDLAVGNDGEPNRLYRNENGVLTGKALWSSDEKDHTQSVAWGDVDGDGDLDLAVGNDGEPNHLYRNDNGMLATSAVWSSDETDHTESIAWGDVDGDGDLDLAVGNYGATPEFGSGEPDRLYRNENGMLTSSAVWFSVEAEHTTSVAWGDVDGDGDLDLAVGNKDLTLPNPLPGIRIYYNEGGMLATSGVSPSGVGRATSSVAWGDVDGDGDLDLAAGHSEPYGEGYDQIYRNNSGILGAVWSSSREAKASEDIAWGDFDNDGDLDLAVAKAREPNRLYHNEAGILQTTAAWISADDNTLSMAWGDVDGDGDLDLAAGNAGSPNKIYRNEGGILQTTATWASADNDNTFSVTWGDVDGDDDLDLAAGNHGSPNKIYRNEGGILQTTATWTSADNDNTNSVAWGDVDGDGDLDLAVGNEGNPNKVYRNEGGILQTTATWISDDDDGTYSVAWGDVDGDGDLDLAAGNYGSPNKVYRNDGGVLQTTASWTSANRANTSSVAWGDVDGDGDLDLATGNILLSDWIYSNEGGVLTNSAIHFSADAYYTWSVAWGDADGDGDLDLATGNTLTLDRLYRNDRGILSSVPHWSALEGSGLGGVAWGDVDGDGDLDLAIGSAGEPNYLFLNVRSYLIALDAIPTVRASLPMPHGQADRYSSASVWSAPTLPITYHLFHPQSIPAGRVYGYYSLDGGGRWLPAVPTSDTNITGRASAPYPITNRSNTHVYNWDVAASGVMGQSDNVVFRLVIFPDLGPRRNRVPGPFLHGSYAATTFPFRLRGTRVKVVDSASNGLSQALVYRLLESQSRDAQLYTDRTGLPYHTDLQGYLQGRGELRKGDYLSALWPVSTADIITFTRNYRLYNTSAKPTAQSLEMKLVENPGVQILTVSGNNKLLLFNLDVALEWDARKDAQFLSQLEFNLQRTSQLLFDWSNGQAALGQVRIFHDARRNDAITGFHPWVDSHIRIYATNRMRPSAAVGGIISLTLEISETVQSKVISYGPGQVHIGALWNRYGESSGTLGEDWPRALAHELGHYLFFMEDDYLGINEQGLLITIPAEGKAEESCPGVMNDPYREAQSEFHPATGWVNSGCTKTLAHQSTGRSDWETLTRFYPLTAPAESFTGMNQGPNTLPLAVTKLAMFDPSATAQTVDVPIFYLTKTEGGAYLPDGSAQAYLFQGEWLTDLGQPTLDQVQAWGARPGDRLCIFAAATGYRGCEQITALGDQVAMRNVGLWQPEIVVTPVSSRTIALSVMVALGDGKLAARLYPTDSPAPGCILLQSTRPGQYAGVFPTLSEPVLDGYVHLWVQPGASTVCSEPQGAAVTEMITAYAIGGNPVHKRARRTLTRGGGVHKRARRAPAISADGQVLVFGEALETNEDEEWFFTVQATSAVPAIPSGRTLVGQAYRLTVSANAPNLGGTSISFGYLGEQAPPGEERFLRIYFWDSKPAACQPKPAPCWRPLATFVDTAYNVASAKTQGAGLYALMSSLEIPLTNVGWNNFAYPTPGAQPVAEALAAIDGAYSIVYNYQSGGADAGWHVYAPSAPDWVNDLKELTFGQAYWIHTTEAIILYLSGQEAARAASTEGLTVPPATFYGTLASTPDFAPQPGMTVTAWVDGHQCGQGQSWQENGQIVFVVKVAADDGTIYDGCGALDRIVTFEIEDTLITISALWDNRSVWSLTPSINLYLPLIVKQQE